MSNTPAFLIVGATGNSGRGVVETLSKLLGSSQLFSNHRIPALTRSKAGASAQYLAGLRGVEVIEHDWIEITESWLRERNVVRAFIASQAQPSQFADESTFLLNARNAGVQYVVRISTTAANVRPDCPAFYPRNHWAIEAMLSSQEFEALQWSSLQPNIWSSQVVGPAAEYVRKFRKDGQPGKLSLILAKDAPIAPVDAAEVGAFAAHLLVQDDVAEHNRAKYVLNGPEDIKGQDIVKLVEDYVGEEVKDVMFEDMSFLDQWVATTKDSKNVIGSIKKATLTAWEGLCTASTTSKTVLEIAPPKRSVAEVLDSLLAE